MSQKQKKEVGFQQQPLLEKDGKGRDPEEGGFD